MINAESNFSTPTASGLPKAFRLPKTALTASFVVAFLAGPCLAATTCPIPSATDLVLGIDKSKSIQKTDAAVWRPVANRFLSCVSSGHLSIYEIDGFTATKRPVFSEPVPVLKGHTVAAVRKFHDEMGLFKSQLVPALDTAFGDDYSSYKTDLFALLERAREEHASAVVIFSDALATETLNLEQIHVTPETAPALTARVMKKLGWERGSLKCDVWVVLPGTASPPIGPNDRRDLKTFYDSLFGALGSNLKLFNDHM